MLDLPLLDFSILGPKLMKMHDPCEFFSFRPKIYENAGFYPSEFLVLGPYSMKMFDLPLVDFSVFGPSSTELLDLSFEICLNWPKI